jgi:4-hydroxy-tetrahydrodipicolinate reductase
MKIAMIGYGKMGQAIEKIAVARGHQMPLKITIDNQHELSAQNLQACDVAIEFTGPESAPKNIHTCLNAGIPIVCGSTGWLQQYQAMVNLCQQKKGALLYASNFSVGVNIFFELNKKLAQLMAPHQQYTINTKEVHHTQKLDAPSGTAITLAEGILANNPTKKTWVNQATQNPTELPIISIRQDPAPGTHIVTYTSAIDDIEISHTAHNRQGFALGAILAAEFLNNKQGVFTMADVLKL